MTTPTASDVLAGKAWWACPVGDALKTLRSLPPECVHCCATSPPYYNQRNYGVAGQIGLEETPAEYVARLVEVFREVRRVLHPSGVLWLNLGDSYANDAKTTDAPKGRTLDGTPNLPMPRKSWRDGTLKKKDLLGIPWSVAFALRDDGWYLRQHCPWVKRNPLPESVTDRPGSACEEVFLLAKRPDYFWDAEAVKRASAPATAADARVGGDRPFDDEAAAGYGRRAGRCAVGDGESRNFRNSDLWFDSVGLLLAGDGTPLGFDVPPRGYRGAHFAVWPPRLVEPMILAGTSARGVCPACGEPWRRVVGRERKATRPGAESKIHGVTKPAHGPGQKPPGEKSGLIQVIGHRDPERHVTVTETLGWEAGCGCRAGGGVALLPDDLELIATPTGSRAGADPTMATGRRGLNRPRGDDEGRRPITRYEQRRYAEQLRASPHRNAMKAEAGDAFDHYVRTDRSGARPIPPDLLAAWLGRGWLAPVAVPDTDPPNPVPAVVLDPFAGSGTTLAVAVGLGRRALGCELNPDYLELVRRRLATVTPSLFGG